jgi:hypothetical protein
MSEDAQRARSPDGYVPGFLPRGVKPCFRESEQRIPCDPRSRDRDADLLRDLLGHRVHVVSPATCHGSDSKSRGMNRSCEYVRRSRATRCDDGVTLTESAEQKLEGTNLVSSAPWRVQILSLDPYSAPAFWKRLNRRGKVAETGARERRQRGKPSEKGNGQAVTEGIGQPARLAE